jgi:MerR family transcriptional regulator, light-induced transcriptional regulator
MWESRHGFPVPERLPRGHRRYGESDVDAVRAVARLRDQGFSLPAAIERVLHDGRPSEGSIFAGLREAHRDLQPAVLIKRALLLLTHAIEDEYCASGSGGLLVGSFQRDRFYREAQRRWREVARTAELAVAMADFECLYDLPGTAVEIPVAEIPVAESLPLAREWILVVDAKGVQACLAAWEQPTQRPRQDLERQFEVMWSFEPQIVRSASQIAIAVMRRTDPTIADRAAAALRELADPSAPELRRASALAHRSVAYLGDTLTPRPAPPRSTRRRTARRPAP